MTGATWKRYVMNLSLRFAPVFALASLVVLAPPVFAQSAKANDSPERLIDVKKVFPFYDIYLGLPAADRDGFSMSYQISSRTSTVRPQLFYQLGTTRTPIAIAANGEIITLPDANMLRHGKVYKPAGQPSGSINMNLEPVIPLSRTISATAATNPLTDYDAAKRRAGPLALMAPRITSIHFVGVTGGEAVTRDNRRIALPTAPNGGVIFTPSSSSMRGVVSLIFPNVPTSTAFMQ
jgi:hypothetical protein